MIDYESIMQKCLKRVVYEVLLDVAENGLTDNQHFYINFSTSYPGVKIPDYLLERYPEEMAIILQYEFKDLEVTRNYFSVVLNFDFIDEKIVVPFGAIINFVDPSVKFGLQFFPDFEENELESFEEKEKVERKGNKEGSKGKNKGEGKIISLEDFRKK